MSVIVVINQSTKITEADCTLMIQGFNKIFPQFATDWNLKSSTVILSNTIPSNAILRIYIMDNTDVLGALEYHDKYNHIPYGTVFVNTVLTNGGVNFYSTNAVVPTVSQCFSHKIFEALVDPYSSIWWQSIDKSSLYAGQVCNPVQGSVVTVSVNNTKINYSDWVLPSWTNPLAKKGPFNHLNTIKAPLTLAPGGYLIKMSAGSMSYVFGKTLSAYTKISAVNDDRVPETVRSQGLIVLGLDAKTLS
jgi:hypothetical protein